jgi:transposase
MPRLTPLQRELACGLLDQGLDPDVVARRLRCDVTTIRRLRRRVATTGSTADRPRSGRPRVTTPRQDRHILLIHSRDRFQSSVATAHQTVGTHGRPVAPHTVRRRLRERGLRARVPYRGPVLDPNRRNRRLEWARLHQRWTYARWRSVLFSDESRICVDRPDRRTRVWRRRGERFQDGMVQEGDRWGGASIMVWAGISYEARTPLVIINGNLNSQRYIEEILEPTVMPFLEEHPEIRFFQQDNARPHSARVTKTFLSDNEISVLDWPPYSPDFSPIEHLWDQLKSAIARRRPRPVNRQELITAAIEEWENLPQQRIQTLFNSMRRRCTACVDANGGHTRY